MNKENKKQAFARMATVAPPRCTAKKTNFYDFTKTTHPHRITFSDLERCYVYMLMQISAKVLFVFRQKPNIIVHTWMKGMPSSNAIV